MDFSVWIRVFTIGTAVAAMAGCDVTKEMAVEKGKDMVASALKDPDSAKFQGVFMVENQAIGDTHYGLLCGEVNSRNSFGGYTGFRRFVANFNYSKQGIFEVGYVTLEEGVNAKINSNGVSYFQDIYWLGKCEPKPAPKKIEQISGELPTTTTAAVESKKTTKPSAAKTAPAAVPEGPKWAVQVASMNDATQAASLQKKITGDGFSSYSVTKDGKTRVFVGPFADRAKAERQAELIRTQQLLKGFVVRVEQ
ncbi:Sporulation related domain-containing protein [Pseudomonas koreensis]|uniref:SPOR domain-containing protein n=1 Tax=Pseudomonas koreensis TaxID=198620 RepID=UPI00087CFFBD|nr:SPOR domain-containing protein [Pseudomonas koreensis]KAB0510880.1 hypothetical protein F7R05_22010 [Pseudomonas koreensis]NNA64373.1 hypothetical protein [Pseudomonas koreensis]GGK53033.1 hypothetical protein GCM10009103_54230 [Pseudomonas koreensis]SDE19667.1 Sporulation related domain-containing protein [Pseudomonas koreensis]